MKRIVSVSIGSKKRDKISKIKILEETYIIERIGTNGSIKEAIEIIKKLDGKVNAFGIGGIDFYLGAGFEKEYIIKETVKIRKAAKITPIVDGSAIKRTIEKTTIKYLIDNNIIKVFGKKVLITSAIDRYKMAEGFYEEGAKLLIGDLIFALGIPYVIKDMKSFKRIAKIFMPIICRLPFKLLYPIGEAQDKEKVKSKYSKIFYEADIIAGDFIYMKKFMPKGLENKTVITNTVTAKDIEFLRDCGVKLLITTTPEFEGRSFGTNMLQGILTCILNKKPEDIKDEEIISLYNKLNYKPRVLYL